MSPEVWSRIPLWLWRMVSGVWPLGAWCLVLGRERAETSAEPEPELAEWHRPRLLSPQLLWLWLLPSSLAQFSCCLAAACCHQQDSSFQQQEVRRERQSRQTPTYVQSPPSSGSSPSPLPLVNTVTTTRGQGTRMSARLVCHRNKGTRLCHIL